MNPELLVYRAVYKTACNAAIKERNEARDTAATLDDINVRISFSAENIASESQPRPILPSPQNHNPLAVTLIDGDGYIFSPEYIKQGRSGGQKAATILSQELLSAAGRRMELFANIYLNRSGLSNVLLANQIIPHKSVFDDFIVGFNQASPLLSIVDAGHGKASCRSPTRTFHRS